LAPALATSTNQPIHAEIGKGQPYRRTDRGAQITLVGMARPEPPAVETGTQISQADIAGRAAVGL
jgi:hypothetical protein